MPRALYWGIAMLIAGLLWNWEPRAARTPAASNKPEPEAEVPVRQATTGGRVRVVYPHSVIPGGAYSRPELEESLAKDSVASEHYRGFNPSTTQLGYLGRPRNVYLSYRVDNSIFWTRKPVTLPAGEAVLTDGENMARARCGNRIAMAPQEPVGPDVDLDTPETQNAAAEDRKETDPLAELADLPLLAHEVFPPTFDQPANLLPGSPTPSGGTNIPVDATQFPYAGGFGGSGAGGYIPFPTRASNSDIQSNSPRPPDTPAASGPPVIVAGPTVPAALPPFGAGTPVGFSGFPVATNGPSGFLALLPPVLPQFPVYVNPTGGGAFNGSGGSNGGGGLNGGGGNGGGVIAPLTGGGGGGTGTPSTGDPGGTVEGELPPTRPHNGGPPPDPDVSVPEPSTGLLFLAAAGLLAMRQTLRRSNRKRSAEVGEPHNSNRRS